MKKKEKETGEEGSPSAPLPAPPARRRGQKRSIRTDDARERILRALRLGQSLDNAAKLGGMCFNSMIAWRDADPSFDEAIQRARAEMEYTMLARIEAAATAPQHWTAAAWKLERMMPETYGRRAIEISGPGGGPMRLDSTIEHKLDQLTVDELRRLAAEEP